MRTVGLRELKSRLAEYIREVRGGERSVVVADRGTVVAEIVPPGEISTRVAATAGLAALAAKGAVTLGAPNDPSVYPELPPLLRPGRVGELLDEERGQH